jgi:hypothetical protein
MITAKLILVAIIGVAQCFLPLCSQAMSEEPKFRDVSIRKSFKKYLLSDPLLMETSGAKIVDLKNGTLLIFAVGSVVLKSNDAASLLEAEKVCRIKALASIVAEKNGVMVWRTEKLTEETIVVERDSEERAESVSTYLETTKTKVEGLAKDMPVIGHWFSADGKRRFIAIGMFTNKQGEILQAP